jgi:hypothetical protein
LFQCLLTPTIYFVCIVSWHLLQFAWPTFQKRSWFVMTITSTNRKGKNAWEIPSLKTYLANIMIRVFQCLLTPTIYFVCIVSWHLLGHAIKSVICFDLQFSRCTRPMTSFCIFIAYINTEGILYSFDDWSWLLSLGK